MYKITVYLSAGGVEVFHHAGYREHLGNLIVEWYARAGGRLNRRVFSPNEYYSFNVESMY